MNPSAWSTFYRTTVTELLRPGTRVLDIGAGLRADISRGNVEDPTHAWMKPLIAQAHYEVMDPVDTYHPDILGSIMEMPIAENQYDAIFCLAVLEHVARPWTSVDEMFRVLKPGGRVFVAVPFLSAYHAMPGYYGDYFRFTNDGLRSLFERWEHVTIVPVRGPIETLVHLLPGRLGGPGMCRIAGWLDRHRSSSGNQAAAYFLSAQKPGAPAL